ncbi:MAG: hypothetical protein ACSHX4_08085 [Opitutaceae bacterium]
MKRKTEKQVPFGFRQLSLPAIGQSWWWSCILVFVVGVIAHLGAIGAIFYQDDFGVLKFNSVPRWSLTDFRFTSSLTWWVNYRMAGLSAPVFHLTNILLHSVVAVLLYVMVRDWLGRVAKLHDRLAGYGALIAALLFAVHPLGTEITHYIRARDTLLMTGLGLTAVYCLSRFTGKNWPQLLWAALFAMLGCYSKPTGVPWVPVLALWTAGCIWSPAIWHHCFNWRHYVSRRHMVLGTLVVLLGIVLLFHNTLSPAFNGIGRMVTTQVESGSAWANALTQLRLTGLLLQQLIWPSDLVSDCFGVYSTRLADPGVWMGIGILVMATVTCVWLCVSGRRVPLWALGVLFGSHLLHCFYPGGDYHAEYRSYPSIIGFCLIIGWATAALAQTVPKKRWLADGAVGLALVLAIYACHQRSADWSSLEKLSDDTLETYPWNMRAHYHGIQSAYERGNDHEVEERAERMRKEMQALAIANKSLPHGRHYNWSHSVLFVVHAEGTVARSLVRMDRSPDAIAIMQRLAANLNSQPFGQQPKFQTTYKVFLAVVLADMGSYSEAWRLARPFAASAYAQRRQAIDQPGTIAWLTPWWLIPLLDEAAEQAQANGHPFTFDEN